MDVLLHVLLRCWKASSPLDESGFQVGVGEHADGEVVAKKEREVVSCTDPP